MCYYNCRVSIHTYGQPIYGLGEFPEWALQEASAACLNSQVHR